MDKKQLLLELLRIYKKLKSDYPLTFSEKELLKKFYSLSQPEKIEFANSVNESVEDIETYIEKDIKRY